MPKYTEVLVPVVLKVIVEQGGSQKSRNPLEHLKQVFEKGGFPLGELDEDDYYGENQVCLCEILTPNFTAAIVIDQSEVPD